MSNEIPLIDVEKVQKRLDAKKDNPYTVLEGSCHIPVDASKGLKKSHLKSTADTFLNSMMKRGYELSSQLRLNGPYPAVEMDSDVVIEDMEEWRIRAVFKKDTPEFTRIELEPDKIEDNNC